MIFGRTGARQANQTPQENAGSGQAAQGGYTQQPGATPWQTAGGTPLAGSYPTQQAGTAYAGYTPGSGQTGGYPGAGAYAQQVQNAYAQQAQNVYAQQGQIPYAQQGQNAYAPQGQNAYAQQAQNAYARQGQTSYAQQAQASYGQGGQRAAYPQAGIPFAQQTAAQNPQQAGVWPGQGSGDYSQAAGGYGAYPGAGQSAGAGYAGGYPGAAPQQTWSGSAGAQGGGYAYSQPVPGQNQGGYTNPYAQMGRNQAQPQQPPEYGSRQIPLNGGGYVPQQVPVKKQPFVFNDGLLILLSAVLLVLFAVGLAVAEARVLLWVFLVLAVGSIAVFFVKPLIAGNKRLCFTIVFAILGVVALVKVTGLLNGSGSGQTQTDPTNQTAGTGSGITSGSTSSGSGQVIDPVTGAVISAVEQPAATATPTAEPTEDTGATDRLETFFYYWSAGMQDEMLDLCAPSWQSGVDNPKTALFGLLANRRPLDYTVEKITGTSESTSRTVTVTSTIDRNNGKDPVKYRLSVLMLKESEQWFVDPQSLKTYEQAETPDPATQATPTPSPEPAASASTILYYNPDGGSKYHLDQNCKSVHAKYLPLKGHFTYGEIDKDQYKNLYPCNVCAAPLRP